MNKSVIICCFAVLMFMGFLTGCDDATSGVLTDISIEAQTVSTGQRAISAGDIVDTVDSYTVIFTKVEIGNSEEEKFTLWEDADGQELDITGAVAFSDPNPVETGVYNYVRLTIGNTLVVTGSIDDEGTVTTGTGTVTLDDTVYLWGQDIESSSGVVTLTDPIEITEQCTLLFQFDITDTVTYQSGGSENTVLSVEKPAITVLTE